MSDPRVVFFGLKKPCHKRPKNGLPLVKVASEEFIAEA
jgi:hypothetical protein